MLIDSLLNAAKRRPTSPAFVTQNGEIVTVQQLADLSAEVALGLKELGVSEGDLVALDLPSDLSYVLAYLAAARLGAMTAGLNQRLTRYERNDLISGVSPDWLLTDAPRPVPGVGREPKEHHPQPPNVVESRTIRVTANVSVQRALHDLRQAVPSGGTGLASPVPRLAADPNRVVAVVFTSGTTGRPKAAVFGESQLEAIARADTGGAIDLGGRVIAATSFAHVGFMTKLAGNLQLGTTMYMIDRWRAADVVDDVARLGLTAITGVPTQIALLVRDELWTAERDVSSVKAIITGGGPLTPGVVRTARQRFQAPLSNRYSSTETGVISGTALDGDPEDAEVSVGVARPGVTIEIRDPSDPLRPADEGEVCVRSAACMTGYLQDPSATVEAMTPDGFVRTRDLGSFDQRGRLVLLGRTGDTFIRGGYNVHPAQIESVLSQHPSIEAVAVAPVDDAVMGAVPVAVIVRRPGQIDPSLAELRVWAADKLSRDKLPERLVTVDELPYTPMNKLDRFALRDLVNRPLGNQHGGVNAQH